MPKAMEQTTLAHLKLISCAQRLNSLKKLSSHFHQNIAHTLIVKAKPHTHKDQSLGKRVLKQFEESYFSLLHKVQSSKGEHQVLIDNIESLSQSISETYCIYINILAYISSQFDQWDRIYAKEACRKIHHTLELLDSHPNPEGLIDIASSETPVLIHEYYNSQKKYTYNKHFLEASSFVSMLKSYMDACDKDSPLLDSDEMLIEAIDTLSTVHKVKAARESKAPRRDEGLILDTELRQRLLNVFPTKSPSTDQQASQWKKAKPCPPLSSDQLCDIRIKAINSGAFFSHNKIKQPSKQSPWKSHARKLRLSTQRTTVSSQDNSDDHVSRETQPTTVIR